MENKNKFGIKIGYEYCIPIYARVEFNETILTVPYNWFVEKTNTLPEYFCRNASMDEFNALYDLAREQGVLLPDTNGGEPHYHIKIQNTEKAQELIELTDEEFYDVMMCLAQKMGYGWMDVEGFTKCLRSCLYEIQDNLINQNGGELEFIENTKTL